MGDVTFVPVILALSVGLVPARATDYVSTQPAQDLAYSLARTSLNAIAAVDPAETGVFVAALHVSGNLLLVRARHPAPQKITAQIKAGEYFQTYLDLIGTPTAAGKLFVTDAGANGVLSGVPGADNIDVIRQEGGRAIAFNGDFSGQGLSAAQYDAKLSDTDAEYARLLKLLLSSVE
jgi:hypothetical protein